MAVQLSDLFTSHLGHFSDDGWTTTASHNTAPTSDFIFDNSHADIRCFIQNTLYKNRTQFELDQLDQTYLDTLTQFELDNVARIQGENWTKTGTGLTTFAVGKISSRRNWRGITAITTGATLNTTFSSLIAVDVNEPATASINLAPDGFTGTPTHLSIIFPNIPAPGTFAYFDEPNSTVRLASDDGAGGHNYSLAVAFSAKITGVLSINHTIGANELVMDLSDFTNTGFDPTKITGVEIVLKTTGAVTAAQTITIMAVRAISVDWKYTEIDYNTRLAALVESVSLDGAAPTVGTEFVQLIRGTDDTTDAKPTDSTISTFFNAGSQTAAGANKNYIDLLFREIKAATTGSVVIARLSWNNTTTKFKIFKEDYVSPTITPTDIITEITIPTLVLEASDDTDDDKGKYFYQIKVVGPDVTVEIFKANSNLFLNPTPVYQHTFNDGATQFEYRNGRIGLYASFYDRDAYIDDFLASVSGFAEYISKPFLSRTPVDGAQLLATFSPDENVFTEFTWFVDSEKLYPFGRDPGKSNGSGGAFRTEHGVFSNQFVVDDWKHAYIELDIFVSARVTATNQPQLYLMNNYGDELTITTPVLKGNNWNRIKIDLTELFGNLTGVFYSLVIQPRINDSRLGQFWIDNVKIGKRTVAWQLRANPTKPFRDFLGMVNNGDGALNLTKEERGTSLQLKAVALSQDAWLDDAGFSLTPHYAELGNSLYDKRFDTR